MKKLIFLTSLLLNTVLIFQMNLAHKRLEAFRAQQAYADQKAASQSLDTTKGGE